MKQQVSLREVNQYLSRYIKVVEQGDEVVITRRGKPVARLMPVASKRHQLTAEQKAAWERTVARMHKGWDIGAGKFKRDDLYDR